MTAQATQQVSAKTTPALLATVAAAMLRGILRGCNVLVDEVKWTVDSTGVTMKAVDPAHVAMVSIAAAKSAFASFDVAAPFNIAFDVENVIAFLKLAGDKDVVTIQAAEDGLQLSFGTLRRWFPALDSTGFTDPKVPKLDLPNHITVPAGQLAEAAQAAEQVSDHLSILQAQGGSCRIRAEGDGANNAVEYQPSELGTVAEAGTTMLSLDYFQSIVKLPGSETGVQLHLRPDYPARFEWTEGSVSYVYLVAPRIESDSGPSEPAPAQASEAPAAEEPEAPEAPSA